MSSLVCEIVSPEDILFSDSAELIVVPGIEGEMGFMLGHMPVVSVLADGIVRLSNKDASDKLGFAVQGGYVEVEGTKVNVLADRAMRLEDIDKSDAQAKLGELNEKLASCTSEQAIALGLDADIKWYSLLIDAAI